MFGIAWTVQSAAKLTDSMLVFNIGFARWKQDQAYQRFMSAEIGHDSKMRYEIFCDYADNTMVLLYERDYRRYGELLPSGD